MPIEDNEPKDCHYDCHQYTGWIQEQVIKKYVYNHGSEKNQTEWNKPIYEEQRATDDLQRSYNPL